ncbi:monovalent cation/H(+) antiporter subunit G [Micromonospora sp. NPDC047548]
MLRFPDVLARMHAATKPQMIGRAGYRSGRVDRALLDRDELADQRK